MRFLKKLRNSKTNIQIYLGRKHIELQDMNHHKMIILIHEELMQKYSTERKKNGVMKTLLRLLMILKSLMQ
jgi:hypothetical protein